MKCLSCNTSLSDYESTRKYTDGTFLDLCCRCHSKSDMDDVPIVSRADLIEDDDSYDYNAEVGDIAGWPNND